MLLDDERVGSAGFIPVLSPIPTGCCTIEEFVERRMGGCCGVGGVS